MIFIVIQGMFPTKARSDAYQIWGPDITEPSLIVSALERLFPTSAGYPTLFPRRKDGGNPDTGLVKAFSKYYVDELFGIGASLLPWTKFPAAFVEDRKSVSFCQASRLCLD